MKLFCIADEETVRGLRLAGIDGQAVLSAAQAVAALEAAAAQPDCGIIVLTEAVAAALGPQLETMRLERDRPLLVTIPGPQGPMPGRKSLRQFVQEAVGMRVN